jgi:hypothetical protein
LALLSEHICYWDDSFDEQIHVVGGYLAPQRIWDEVFSPAWKGVITNAPHPISEFKSSDCRLRNGEYRSWTGEEVESLTSQLVSVILGTPLYAGVSVAFIWPGNPDPGSPKARRWRRQLAREGYRQCIRFCLAEALSLSDQLPETEKIRLVFDNRGKFFQAMQKSFDEAIEILGPSLAGKVEPPIMMDSKQAAPLQAADLLAYETYREVIGRMEDLPPSSILERLVAGRTPYVSTCIATPLLAKGATGGQPRSALGQRLFKRGRPLRAPGLWGCVPPT